MREILMVHDDGAEFDAPVSEHRIVVGVDGSVQSERALDWAITQAQRGGATLEIVTAWTFPMALGYAFTATVNEVRQAAQNVVDGAIARVAKVAPDVIVRGHPAEESPGPALVTASEGAELLVVGSRGIGGFKELLLGSVSQFCTGHASCSVAVVR
jgi:nucleotide-binding universal stress UspA family protein